MQWDKVALPPGADFRHLSPDSRWVIYSMDNSETRWQQTYWLAKIENGKLISPVAITEHTQENRAHSWGFSPDSSSFMFEFRSSQEQSFISELWLIDTDDLRDRRMIYAGPTLLRGGTWAPDNRHITIFNSDWGADMLTTDDETVTESIVPPGTFGKALITLSWSPTCGKVVYPESHRETWNVWVADLSSRERQLLIANNAPVKPIWSPSGESIALLGFVNGVDGKPGLKVLNADGQIQFSIDLIGWSSWMGMWSPEGTRFAVALQEHVGVVTLPTGKLSRIPVKGDANIEVCGWAPDGQAVIVTVNRDETPILLRVPIIP
jgi:Tol biopolymer transport system component